MARGRRSIGLDLKRPQAIEIGAGVGERRCPVEGFRPGVTERWGWARACLARNPRLVYGRVTGWVGWPARAGAVTTSIHRHLAGAARHRAAPDRRRCRLT